MKFSSKILLFFLLIGAGFLSSCSYDVPVLPGSGGKTCEIIVVTPKNIWQGSVGDSIRKHFASVQPGLNQPEPYFDLVNIQPSQFNESEMFQHHRNIIIVEFDSNEDSRYELFQDPWAFPQVVMKYTVPDVDAFNRMFTTRKERMMQSVYAKEYQRIQKVFKESEQLNITEQLRNKFKFEMVFPDGFQFASQRRDFGWIRKESKDYGQGIIFSIYPYSGHSDFELENILNRRNEMVQLVPGPADGSYMSTETGFPECYPTSRPINLNGLYAIETRGLWRLEGDFMGGPFVNYVIPDTANNRIVMLDAYLYSPRKAKRDLLLQMEGIARSFQLFTPERQSDTISE